jgi:hypothetical protein
MSTKITGFEIVFVPRVSGHVRVLADVPDADAATVAFHQAQDDLYQAGATGELVVLDTSDVRRLVLRTAICSGCGERLPDPV